MSNTHALARIILFATLTVLFVARQPAEARCAGDCDGNGVVTVNELVTAVNIAIGRRPAADCPGACPSPPLCIDFLLTAVDV
jgi:hypothetical protein